MLKMPDVIFYGCCYASLFKFWPFARLSGAFNSGTKGLSRNANHLTWNSIKDVECSAFHSTKREIYRKLGNLKSISVMCFGLLRIFFLFSLQ
jgi:hypothetical protein